MIYDIFKKCMLKHLRIQFTPILDCSYDNRKMMKYLIPFTYQKFEKMLTFLKTLIQYVTSGLYFFENKNYLKIKKRNFLNYNDIYLLYTKIIHDILVMFF